MNKKEFIYLLLIFVLFTVFSLNRHSKAQIFTYHSEIWADKAGYNVYLPALFIYDFNATNFPDSIDYKTGNGFVIDKTSNKVITKYPYGVALLQSPFWLISHLIDKEKKGYSKTYNKAIDISAIFYFVIGLFFLYKLFDNNQEKKTIILTLLFSILGTNLLYYAVWETGMSHIYSFAFFAILLFLLSKKIFDYQLILVCLMILIIRPINIVFLTPILLLFDIQNKADFLVRIKALTTKSNIFKTILLSILVFLPQFLYNNYAFEGSGINSYQNESFIFLSNPKILEVLFAPNNGLFLYAPILLVIFSMIIFKFKRLKSLSYLPILLLLIYVIVYASWWSYMLGCGLGHRGFVDILPVYIYMLFYLIKTMNNNKIFYVLLLILSLYTTKITFSYDGCFYGKWDWDWKAYQQLVVGKAK